MTYLNAHPSIDNNDIESFIEYSNKNNIRAIVGVPIIFFIRNHKYQDLLWTYTRAIYYITQLLISRYSEDADQNDPIIVQKNKIREIAMDMLEDTLEEITKLETKFEINNILAKDNFLNKKLYRGGIDQTKISDAKEEVKKIFAGKGYGNNDPINKIIDVVTNKMSDVDINNGNMLSNLYNIVGEVAGEVRQDITNPDEMKQMIGVVTETLNEQVGADDAENLPSGFKELFHKLKGINMNGNNEMTPDEFMNDIGGILKDSGISQDDMMLLNEKF